MLDGISELGLTRLNTIAEARVELNLGPYLTEPHLAASRCGKPFLALEQTFTTVQEAVVYSSSSPGHAEINRRS